MKCDLEYDFQDLEKMPKHVEMVRTKCQPKSWDGQNANHRKKSGQNANLGWHYVRLAFCPVGILSYHLVSRELINESQTRDKQLIVFQVKSIPDVNKQTNMSSIPGGKSSRSVGFAASRGEDFGGLGRPKKSE